MVGYTELLTKFNALKEKECAIMTQTGSKKEKKESLLRLKEKKTLTKAEQLELEHINTEEDIETSYRKNIRTIQLKKQRAEDEAERVFLAAVANAEAIRDKNKLAATIDYERVEEYYNGEKSASLNKENKTYSKKKASLELQQEAIEDERNISIKTATEISIEKDKRDLLTQMKAIIDILQISRNQAPLIDQEKLPAVPVLPETIVSHYVPVQPPPIQLPPPIQSVSTETYEYDPDTSRLREEFRMKRRELERAEREREREESARKPTKYGFIHELEGRPYVKPRYNPPAPDCEETEPVTEDFTKFN